MSTIVCVVARLRAAPGRGDALADLLVEQASAVRAAEPGCTAYRVLRSTTDPEQFLFYETYVDSTAFEAHRTAPHLAQYRQRREREGLTAGPAEVEILRALTE